MIHENFAKDILSLVGGKENIEHATYCVTRLRLTLKDRGIVKDEDIKKLDDVIAVKEVGGQYQIVIGPEVERVYKEFCKIAEIKESNQINENLDEIDSNLKRIDNQDKKFSLKNTVSNLVALLSSIFVPLIPAMLGASLIKVMLIFTDKFFGINGSISTTYQLLDILQNSFFYFMPILVGWSAAKKFHSNVVIVLLIIGFLINPSTMEVLSSGTATFFGIKVANVSYVSSVIPAIFTAFVVGKIESILQVYVPSMMKTLVVPVTTTFLSAVIILLLLGPIGYWLGLAMAFILGKLYAFSPILSGALIGGLWNLMIVTGMHMVVLQLVRNVNIAANGVDFVCVACVAGITCNIAAGLAVGLRTKNKKLRKEAIELSLTSLFAGNIIEPVMYGINIKYKRPFYFTLIGGAIGGIIISVSHAGVYAPVIFSIYSLPAYFGPGFEWLIIGVLVACLVTFVLTYKFGLPEEALN
ncbi:PTS transporter subunit EIIC [Faecalicoccus pleomorphus]|uniref:PTS transporter subunit EIIC n=1 Tax=Faecalicoccus pleomorphus TaxID=1323 RepID=UPI002432408C|nr:PTS transporter subunit EIIC [Faecalicoccus pleomorphus]